MDPSAKSESDPLISIVMYCTTSTCDKIKIGLDHAPPPHHSSPAGALAGLLVADGALPPGERGAADVAPAGPAAEGVAVGQTEEAVQAVQALPGGVAVRAPVGPAHVRLAGALAVHRVAHGHGPDGARTVAVAVCVDPKSKRRQTVLYHMCVHVKNDRLEDDFTAHKSI